jgi:hypothetical protein
VASISNVDKRRPLENVSCGKLSPASDPFTDEQKQIRKKERTINFLTWIKCIIIEYLIIVQE